MGWERENQVGLEEPNPYEWLLHANFFYLQCRNKKLACEPSMQNQSTLVIDHPYDVEAALAKVGLTKQKVVHIAKAASSARAEYLPNVDPVNFPGTRAYQEGTRQLRLQTLPDGWKTRKFNNIELVYNDQLSLMVGFQNVDCACSSTEPQAISSRGEGTRQLVAMPYERSLFSDGVPHLSPSQEGSFPIVWFVCVAAYKDRIQVEVSRPKPFEDDQFNGFFERIFVANESLEAPKFLVSINDEIEDDHEIVITKKQNGNS
ncbi:hypothetical protein [Pseudomonas sp. FFUP_PS_473]|uniref:hypothetical protein n=1 Tax=Pseudomonas sp. FFUP_PS_473 TaxID=2060418 RepID=UPI0011AEA9B5|nr:hypothetical protein [Pseudomonas sp. FFUP_PS_473]